MTLSRNLRILMLALVAGIWICYAGANVAKATPVPVQAQFVNPPATFGWSTVVPYRIQLKSSSKIDNSAQVTMRAFAQAPPGTPGKGGMMEYRRTFLLNPGQTKTFTFRVMTASGPFFNASYTIWCMEAEVGVKGAAPQTIKTCALPSTSQPQA